MVDQLARKAGIHRTPQLYLVNKNTPNAFALGTKDQPVIGITSGLLHTLNERELKGVLAHEISHIKNNDLFIKGLAASFGNLTNTLSWIGRILLIISIPLYLMGSSPISLIAVVLLIFSPGINILMQLGLSRSMEYLADHDAAMLTNDPMGLASALYRIESISLPWWQRWNPLNANGNHGWLRSHPLTRNRIMKLKEMTQSYPQVDQIARPRMQPMGYRKSPFAWTQF